MKQNNNLFGNDSFDLTGNHNTKVNIRNQVATERAAKYIMMDASLIDPDSSDEDFELTIAPEPFIFSDFWRIWIVLISCGYFVLAYYLPYGYVMATKHSDSLIV